jgi:DNA-binding transcriptional LysR family regulator
MKFDHINFNNLRVFEAVFREGSMTSAARILHLTQSGVSQHILALEDELDLRLFDRINKRIIPTEAGRRLYQVSRPALLEIETTIGALHSERGQIAGTVRMGLPIDFGSQVVIPQLAQLGRLHPRLKFELQLASASVLAQSIYDGQLDLAIVDSYPFDRSVQVERVAKETLLLCASREYLSKKGSVRSNKAFLESLDYIAYQGGEHILRSWMNHHLRRKNIHLNIRAHVMNVTGVYNFIKHHLGAGILPHHSLKSLGGAADEIVVIDGSSRPLTNEMSMVFLKDRSPQPTIAIVKEFLQKSFRAERG